MVVCDRKSFMMFVNGRLIDRDISEGKFDICNEVTAQKALDALTSGESIFLTVNDHIFSQMIPNNNGFHELVADPE